tara:strand:+ start:842 stop:1549 length:708 start_codon:yes stop_codon:yes gene_type:complete
MLAQKLGLSLPTIKSSWNPIEESSLLAWWKNNTKVEGAGGLRPSVPPYRVATWFDSSGNEYNLSQSTEVEQPTLNPLTGALTFTPASPSNLNLKQPGYTQIEIAAEFSIAMVMSPNATNVTLLADNTTSDEFMKITDTNKIRLTIDGSSKTLTLNTVNFGRFFLLTRNQLGLLEIFIDGVLQTDNATLEGTFDIDSMGVRAVDLNPFDGDISEAIIYTEQSADLSYRINSYYSTI